MERIEISKYLRNSTKVNGTGKGSCRYCDKLIQWSRPKVAAHVRKCSGYSEEEKAKFAIRNDKEEDCDVEIEPFEQLDDMEYEESEESEDRRTFAIQKYLKDYNPHGDKCGNCRFCDKRVQWNRQNVPSHMRACIKASDDVKAFFAKSPEFGRRESTYSIIEYMKDFRKYEKKGKCRACDKELIWKKFNLAAHKLSSCPNVSAEEKNFFATAPENYPNKARLNTSFKKLPEVVKVEKTPPKTRRLNVKTVQEERVAECDSIAISGCFVCKSLLGSPSKRLVQSLDYSGTLLFEILENFTGIDISKGDLKSSCVCMECFNQFNKYDKFQHESKEIQTSICEIFNRSRSVQVFVKREPEVDLDFEEEYLILEDGQDAMFLEHSEVDELSMKDESGIKAESMGENELGEADDVVMEQLDEFEDVTVERFSCDKCAKQDLTRVQMQFHMVSEHSGHDGPFECPLCSKIYATRKKLHVHHYLHKSKPLCPR